MMVLALRLSGRVKRVDLQGTWGSARRLGLAKQPINLGDLVTVSLNHKMLVSRLGISHYYISRASEK
jgi:hypothetical protein